MAEGEAGRASYGASGDNAQQEQERQQRVSALRELSRLGESQAERPPTTAAKPGGDGSHPRRGRWRLPVLIGLIALVIAGSATGYLLIARSGFSANNQKKPAPVHAIDLSASKLYCPQTPVWSPDGRQIAIIASDVRCIEQNNTTPPDQFIGVFDATTGKPDRIIAFKDALAPFKLDGMLTAIAWSPDSKSLALFGPVLPTPTVGVNLPALVLYPLTGQQAAPRVIVASETSSDLTNPQVWNVDGSTAGPVIDGLLAPALTYRWTSDGHIATAQPFPPDESGVTGRSASDGVITFWQTGYLDALSILDGHYTNTHFTNGATGPVAPTGVFFSASPVLWSPDGRYVVSGVSMGGPVVFSMPPTAAMTCPSPDPNRSQSIPCQLRALPQPDPAFAAVATATLKGESFTFTNQSGNPVTTSSWPEVPVAWSSNGKYLLTILPGDEERDKVDQTTVTVFETVTGMAVKQYQQKIPMSGASCSSVYPAWSPNGARIALAQCSTDSIILWNSGDLPT